MNLSSLALSEASLCKLFLSILCLLVSSHCCGYIFNRLNMPRVIGEILGGIILGPSVLGLISPEYYNEIFNYFPEQGKVLAFLYWTGLVLLMVTAGFKTNHSSKFLDKKIVFNLIISSTILPLLGGFLYYKLYDFSPYKGIHATDFSMVIIVCISIAITSIPVISKIFIDLGIMQSNFAKIVLTAAILHDLILWIALDVAIKDTIQEQTNPYIIAANTVLFLFCSLIIGPYLIKYITNLKGNLLLKSSLIGYLICVCLIVVIVASLFKINMVFGALMAGIILGKLPNEKFQTGRDLISDFSMAFFIPLYFAIVGLKINLPAYFDLRLFLEFLLISSLLEIGAVMIGLKLAKKSWLTSINFGIAMNTRGGPGIVIASMAYEFSIINQTFFVVLILSAITTSLMSGIWFKFILNHKLALYENDQNTLIESDRVINNSFNVKKND